MERISRRYPLRPASETTQELSHLHSAVLATTSLLRRKILEDKPRVRATAVEVPEGGNDGFYEANVIAECNESVLLRSQRQMPHVHRT